MGNIGTNLDERFINQRFVSEDSFAHKLQLAESFCSSFEQRLQTSEATLQLKPQAGDVVNLTHKLLDAEDRCSSLKRLLNSTECQKILDLDCICVNSQLPTNNVVLHTELTLQQQLLATEDKCASLNQLLQSSKEISFKKIHDLDMMCAALKLQLKTANDGLHQKQETDCASALQLQLSGMEDKCDSFQQLLKSTEDSSHQKVLDLNCTCATLQQQLNTANEMLHQKSQNELKLQQQLLATEDKCTSLNQLLQSSKDEAHQNMIASDMAYAALQLQLKTTNDVLQQQKKEINEMPELRMQLPGMQDMCSTLQLQLKTANETLHQKLQHELTLKQQLLVTEDKCTSLNQLLQSSKDVAHQNILTSDMAYAVLQLQLKTANDVALQLQLKGTNEALQQKQEIDEIPALRMQLLGMKDMCSTLQLQLKISCETLQQKLYNEQTLQQQLFASEDKCASLNQLLQSLNGLSHQKMHDSDMMCTALQLQLKRANDDLQLMQQLDEVPALKLQLSGMIDKHTSLNQLLKSSEDLSNQKLRNSEMLCTALTLQLKTAHEVLQQKQQVDDVLKLKQLLRVAEERCLILQQAEVDNPIFKHQIISLEKIIHNLESELLVSKNCIAHCQQQFKVSEETFVHQLQESAHVCANLKQELQTAESSCKLQLQASEYANVTLQQQLQAADQTGSLLKLQLHASEEASAQHIRSSVVQLQVQLQTSDNTCTVLRAQLEAFELALKQQALISEKTEVTLREQLQVIEETSKQKLQASDLTCMSLKKQLQLSVEQTQMSDSIITRLAKTSKIFEDDMQVSIPESLHDVISLKSQLLARLETQETLKHNLSMSAKAVQPLLQKVEDAVQQQLRTTDVVLQQPNQTSDDAYLFLKLQYQSSEMDLKRKLQISEISYSTLNQQLQTSEATLTQKLLASQTVCTTMQDQLQNYQAALQQRVILSDELPLKQQLRFSEDSCVLLQEKIRLLELNYAALKQQLLESEVALQQLGSCHFSQNSKMQTTDAIWKQKFEESESTCHLLKLQLRTVKEKFEQYESNNHVALQTAPETTLVQQLRDPCYLKLDEQALKCQLQNAEAALQNQLQIADDTDSIWKQLLSAYEETCVNLRDQLRTTVEDSVDLKSKLEVAETLSRSLQKELIASEINTKQQLNAFEEMMEDKCRISEEVSMQKLHSAELGWKQQLQTSEYACVTLTQQLQAVHQTCFLLKHQLRTLEESPVKQIPVSSEFQLQLQLQLEKSENACATMHAKLQAVEVELKQQTLTFEKTKVTMHDQLQVVEDTLTQKLQAADFSCFSLKQRMQTSAEVLIQKLKLSESTVASLKNQLRSIVTFSSQHVNLSEGALKDQIYSLQQEKISMIQQLEQQDSLNLEIHASTSILKNTLQESECSCSTLKQQLEISGKMCATLKKQLLKVETDFSEELRRNVVEIPAHNLQQCSEVSSLNNLQVGDAAVLEQKLLVSEDISHKKIHNSDLICDDLLQLHLQLSTEVRQQMQISDNLTLNQQLLARDDKFVMLQQQLCALEVTCTALKLQLQYADAALQTQLQIADDADSIWKQLLSAYEATCVNLRDQLKTTMEDSIDLKSKLEVAETLSRSLQKELIASEINTKQQLNALEETLKQKSAMSEDSMCEAIQLLQVDKIKQKLLASELICSTLRNELMLALQGKESVELTLDRQQLEAKEKYSVLSQLLSSSSFLSNKKIYDFDLKCATLQRQLNEANEALQQRKSLAIEPKELPGIFYLS